MIALLMLTVGTWAQTVDDVTVKITPEGAGTVVPSVNDKGVCTLTVTPATGYYLTVDNLTAVATLKGGAMQAPKRALPINNGILTIMPDEGNIDPAGVTKYTFEIEDGWNVEVTAEFQAMAVYDLYIGSTRVNGLNANDVLGNGKVSFTPATDNTPATLTLNGAAITAPLKVGLANLTIDIQGENTITTSETCLQNLLGNDATPSLTFTSTSSTVGSLILTHNGGVSEIGNVTISNELVPVLSVYGYEDYTSNMYYFTDGSTSKVKFLPSLGVKVGEMQVHAGNAGNVLKDEGTPTAVYDAENHILTLNGASIIGEISTSLDNLIIELVGENTLTQQGSYATLQSMYGNNVTMTIQSTGATKGSLTMNMPYTEAGTFTDNHVTLNIVSPLAIISGRLTGNQTNNNTVTIGEAKGLVVGGYAVTEDNCNDILNDGTLSYNTMTNTLTLNGATLYPYNDWCVQVGKELSYLNVELLGNNIMRGNAFKYDVSKPALVFKTDPITPGSLLIGPFTEGQTDYSLISPDQENGSQVYYEDNLTSETTSESIMIGGPTINLKVDGVTVTNQNKDDILKDGKVSFNPLTNTLKLDNATIDMTGKDGSPIESNVNDLKVQLIGNNTFTANSTSAYGFKYTPTSNTGTLKFTHEENGFGNLTVNNGTGIASGYTVDGQGGWTVTTNSVSYDTTFGVQIGSTAFKASALTIDSENGSATYSPIAGTLSLNNFTTADNITTTLENLTIVVTGANSVGAVSYNGQNEDATITIEKNMSSEATINKLVASSLNGFETVTVVDPLNDMSTGTQVIISDVVTYNLWVNGTQVTKENMEAIAKGISFDGDATLTLTNVNTTSDDAPFITNGLSKLTIRLVGTNAVDCGQQVFLAKKEGDIDHQVTFTTDANAVGKLTVKVSESNSWYTGHSKVTLLNKLQEHSSVEGTVKTVTIQAPTAEYGLSVNGVALTNLNANDVFEDGSVKYDATTNVLTLKKAQLDGDIISDIDELFIQLHGDCEVNAFGRTVNSQGKLKFSLSGDQGKLTLTEAISTEKFEVTTTDRLTFDEDKKVLALPTSYGITVAGKKIDSENRLHVLGEGNESVVFDNNAQLILNNATINGQIVVDNASNLPDNTLTINLNGMNIINLGVDEKAVKCLNGTLNLIITLDAGNKAKLLINTYDDKVTKDDVFSGITSTFEGLTLTGSADEKQLLIEYCLPNIVNQEGQEGGADFGHDLNPGTNTNNQNINGVLVTLGDESGDKEGSSGYDQTQNALVFVGAAAMTEDKLQEVLEEQPGTKTYADKFTGLTFALPAGSSIIEIASYISDPDYAFYIQVGDQEPIEVESGFGNTSAAMALTSLKIVVGQAGVVKLFMMKKKKTENQEESGAPQMDMVNRRIGPKSSVAGGLGGITIKNNNVQSASKPASTYKSMELKVLTSALASIGDVYRGYTCNDPDITDLPDNMFLKTNTSNAPSRRAAVETILPEGLTYLDFSNTKITGMEISRTSGPFNGVSENVFIYLPAGNTTKEKNVVIGSICDKLELNGESDAKPFKAMKNFTAAQAVLKRKFNAGGDDAKATIYLPYAIPQEEADKLGTFYEYDSNDGTTVSMTKVTKGGLKANKPYIFQAKAGGVENPLVRVVSVAATPVETEGFVGVYERKDYEVGMYCYAAEARDNNSIGQFVEMGPGSYVPPFRAYIIGNGAPSYAIAWDGVIDDIQNEENATAIETVKTVADKKVAEGWWTINGMRLNTQPKKAGMYVFNGRLVVVK
jgi:hypothetical protein